MFGSLTDTVYAASVAVLNDHGYVEWPRPGTRMPLVAVGGGGVVALAGASSAYRIDVLRADFTDSLVICRQAPPFPLTETESPNQSWNSPSEAISFCSSTQCVPSYRNTYAESE